MPAQVRSTRTARGWRGCRRRASAVPCRRSQAEETPSARARPARSQTSTRLAQETCSFVARWWPGCPADGALDTSAAHSLPEAPEVRAPWGPSKPAPQNPWPGQGLTRRARDQRDLRESRGALEVRFDMGSWGICRKATRNTTVLVRNSAACRGRREAAIRPARMPGSLNKCKLLTSSSRASWPNLGDRLRGNG